MEKRRNPVDQDKMSKVIGAELRFKAVRRLAQRRGHYAGVGDDDVFGEIFSCCRLHVKLEISSNQISGPFPIFGLPVKLTSNKFSLDRYAVFSER
jgi:hypothetical protein